MGPDMLSGSAVTGQCCPPDKYGRRLWALARTSVGPTWYGWLAHTTFPHVISWVLFVWNSFIIYAFVALLFFGTYIVSFFFLKKPQQYKKFSDLVWLIRILVFVDKFFLWINKYIQASSLFNHYHYNHCSPSGKK